MHRTIRPLLVAAGAGGLLLATASAASAHISASPSESPAGGYAVIGFSVPHGCDGSPTTSIAIQIPDGINSVTPTVVAGWDIAMDDETLAEPIDDGEGGQITERVASVTYTATDPLPAEFRQVFELSMKMPDAEGDTLAFPIIQTCVEGSTDWITVPVEGEDEPEHPAPVVVLTAATGDEHGGGATGDDTASSSDGDGDGTGLAIAALVVGGLGLVTGGVALAKSRKTTSA